MSILGQVKVPGCSNELDGSAMVGHAFSATTATKEDFDSYLTKLQNICTENMGTEEVKPIQHHQHHHHPMTNPAAGPALSINTTMPTSI